MSRYVPVKMKIDKEQAITYLTISIIYSVIGIPANTLSLIFFLKRSEKKHISRFIFIFLNVTDLFICFCFILLSVSYISLLLDSTLVTSPLYCSVLLSLFPTAQQFSVFIAAVLCLVRTVSIVKPMLNIPKKIVICIIILYLFMIIIRVIMLFRNPHLKTSFRLDRLKCGWEVKESGKLADFSKVSLALISLILIPASLGCLVTILHLNYASPQIPISQSKRRATITVVILTAISLTASSPFVVERVMRMRGVEIPAVMENVALQFAYSFTCVANPAVYFLRLDKLRVFVCALCKRGGTALSGGTKNSGLLSREDTAI